MYDKYYLQSPEIPVEGGGSLPKHLKYQTSFLFSFLSPSLNYILDRSFVRVEEAFTSSAPPHPPAYTPYQEWTYQLLLNYIFSY